jgi:hypothetical protein
LSNFSLRISCVFTEVRGIMSPLMLSGAHADAELFIADGQRFDRLYIEGRIIAPSPVPVHWPQKVSQT